MHERQAHALSKRANSTHQLADNSDPGKTSRVGNTPQGGLLKNSGHPLDASIRTQFERRLGHDFSHVRVHTGEEAVRVAHDFDAKACTSGSHIIFNQGQFVPHSSRGRRLLEHELAHVALHGHERGRVFREPDSNKNWHKDRDGNLYYDSEKQAEIRMAKLKEQGEWEEYRITSFTIKNTRYWRVEMRNRKQAGNPEADPKPETEPQGEPEVKSAPEAQSSTSPASGTTREFALTFDDGPHIAALGTGKNRTEKVLDALKSKGVKGGFFIQTGVSHRGADEIGKQLVARMHMEGHKVGIHTGGTIDHELHTEAQKAGRLSDELQAAKEYIKTETDEDTSLVRPPTGKSNEAVLKTYASLSLTNLLWDIDGDLGATSLAKLKARLESSNSSDPGIPAIQARGWKGTTPSAPKIVVLYHDVRKGTADNIGSLVDHIKKVTQDVSGGKDTASFVPP